MIFFSILVSFVIAQRLGELLIAKRNELWMIKQGGKEYGQGHYKYLVFMHSLFFVSLIVEVTLLEKSLSPIWPILLVLFVSAQLLRLWSLLSLGRYWNTKIIIVPGAQVVQKGPYQFIRHPNYFVVGLEILTLPLLFHAFITAVTFSIANAILLSIRIPVEEKALKESTNYGDALMKLGRFSFSKK